MLLLRDNFPPEYFNGLKFDTGMGNFSDYSSIIQDVEVFKKAAGDKDKRVVVALMDDKVIVGYVVCGNPEPQERWSKLGKLMYEMTTIEVSRNFRQLGIGGRMIAMVLSKGFFEDKVAYLSSFSWHWDLEGTGLALGRYRKMMAGLMESHGFIEYYTNEPNVAIKEENIFMARIGSRVLENDRKRFHYLRFGVTEQQLSSSWR
jgi:acetoin utilization protein AcuA